MKPLHLLVVALLFVLLFVFVKKQCGRREGMSHRLTNTHLLSDNSYSYSSLPSYTQKWNYGYDHSHAYGGSREDFRYPTAHRSKSCSPESYYNEYQGMCQPRFQGVASAQGIKSAPYPDLPQISLPGSIMPGYGTGSIDPMKAPVYLKGEPLMLVSGN